MITQAIFSTASLGFIAIVSRMLTENSVTDEHGAGMQLMYESLHWRDVALQDTDAIVRLQHSAMALAYLQGARSTTRDIVLERSLGMDINKFSKSVNSLVYEARGMLKVRRKPPASSNGASV